MSVYSVKGKGWRYDFTLNGQRLTAAWFKTKKEAAAAEAKRKEEMENPETVPPVESTTPTPTDMAFLELVNKRLDHVKAYNSALHYSDHVYFARRWLKEWKNMTCAQIKRDHIERFILKRSKVSAITANKEIRLLRATFNFGLKRGFVQENPLDGVDFLPVEKKLKYIPPVEDLFKVISAAEPDTQDYLWTMAETLGRMREINQLTWDDVNLAERYVVLYTRKKKGGHRTPRKVPMTQRLYEILLRRSNNRVIGKPWVFWHRYWSKSEGKFMEGPYQDRKRLMMKLCEKAGVQYFRYHALRHAGASLMDSLNVPIGSIQRILGHENRTTTELYLHCVGDPERRAMSVFESARKKSHTDSHTGNEKRVSTDLGMQANPLI